VSDLEELEQALAEALRGLRRYRELVERLLGGTDEERKRMLRAAKGLSSTEIMVALEEYADRRRLLDAALQGC
jgi:hypothetical protein